MPDLRELLERESTSVDLEPGHFDRLLGRRDRKRRNQRIRAGVLALTLALLTFVALARAFSSSERTADEPHPPKFSGMVIRHTGRDPGGSGDLVAENPSTGETITLVDHKVPGFRARVFAWAAASADGRWAAFESPFCDDRSEVADWEERSGLWVTNGTDEPRQLTTPCLEEPGLAEPRPWKEGRWAWSPTTSEIAAVEGDRLVLIDPATGDRTDLGKTEGDLTSLAWSPDGSRIAYASVPAGSPDGTIQGSVFVVGVDDGEHASIAESIGYVPGGEEGSGIRWSPDGTSIAILAGGSTRGTLYVMNADGSDRRPLAESVLIEHALGSPNIVWSPDGTRIAYATMSEEARDELQIWNGSPRGSNPVLVFGSTSLPEQGNTVLGGPVWSPNGSQIAFRYDATQDEKGWLIANADGNGDVHEIDELQPLSWRGGWYFCECYG